MLMERERGRDEASKFCAEQPCLLLRCSGRAGTSIVIVLVRQQIPQCGLVLPMTCGPAGSDLSLRLSQLDVQPCRRCFECVFGIANNLERNFGVQLIRPFSYSPHLSIINVNFLEDACLCGKHKGMD
jgi:hypothetical protein